MNAGEPLENDEDSEHLDESDHLNIHKSSSNVVESTADEHHANDELYRQYISSAKSHTSEDKAHAYHVGGDSSHGKQIDDNQDIDGASFDDVVHHYQEKYMHSKINCHERNYTSSGGTVADNAEDKAHAYHVDGDSCHGKHIDDSQDVDDASCHSFDDAVHHYQEKYMHSQINGFEDETYDQHVNGETHHRDLSSKRVSFDDVSSHIIESKASKYHDDSEDETYEQYVNGETHQRDLSSRRVSFDDVSSHIIESKASKGHDDSGRYPRKETKGILKHHHDIPTSRRQISVEQKMHAYLIYDGDYLHKHTVSDISTFADEYCEHLQESDHLNLHKSSRHVDDDTTDEPRANDVEIPNRSTKTIDDYRGIAKDTILEEDVWTEVEEEELQDVLQQLDEDKSGKLTCKEKMKRAYQCMGYNPTDEEIETALRNNDADGDGKYDYEEFKTLVMAVKKAMPDKHAQAAQMREALDTVMGGMDQNNDGTVTREELKDFLMNKGDEKLTQEEVDRLFEELHVDQTNKLSIKELFSLLSPPTTN